MRSRHTIPVLFALLVILAHPATTNAGPIQFELTPTGWWVDPEKPILANALLPADTSGGFTFDPTAGVPTVIPVVQYDPSRIPQPRPIDLHPGGWATWNNEGFFRVDMRLTDTASREHADFSLWGRAHAYNQYADGQWNGYAMFWFGDWGNARSFNLGGNEFSVWGQERFTDELPAISVWVGPNSPGPHAPEPGTLLLAALGLAPLGLRALRSRRTAGVSRPAGKLCIVRTSRLTPAVRRERSHAACSRM
jgi:hypothetical protein